MAQKYLPAKIWMEPANGVILRISPTVKMTTSLLTHSPHVKGGMPNTTAHLTKSPMWSKASGANPQRAAWRWRQLLIAGDLKIPMPMTAPPCGVQRQVICFSFFHWFPFPFPSFHSPFSSL
uniref:Synaptotagmin XIV-like protein n=1 Tax=Pan troglodytes TaxID=9598 RepID=G2HI33_PANTR|nr:synaptotagmin XIV-like protein [Pan troglodytes]